MPLLRRSGSSTTSRHSRSRRPERSRRKPPGLATGKAETEKGGNKGCIDEEGQLKNDILLLPSLNRRRPAVNAATGLACPFFQRDPSSHNPGSRCSGPGWPTVHRLKEHLYRKHLLDPPHRCRQCGHLFEEEDHLSNHTNQKPSCQPSPVIFTLGLDSEQHGTLKLRKKGDGQFSDEKKWREIYRLLFPDVSFGNIPSPHYQSPPHTLAHREEVLKLLQTQLIKVTERAATDVENMVNKAAGLAAGLDAGTRRIGDDNQTRLLLPDIKSECIRIISRDMRRVTETLATHIVQIAENYSSGLGNDQEETGNHKGLNDNKLKEKYDDLEANHNGMEKHGNIQDGNGDLRLEDASPIEQQFVFKRFEANQVIQYRTLPQIEQDLVGVGDSFRHYFTSSPNWEMYSPSPDLTVLPYAPLDLKHPGDPGVPQPCDPQPYLVMMPPYDSHGINEAQQQVWVGEPTAWCNCAGASINEPCHHSTNNMVGWLELEPQTRHSLTTCPTGP